MDELLKFLGLDKFVVVDLETTGLSAERESIIEYAFIKYRNGKLHEKLTALCRPDNPIPPEIQEITGITNEMVRDKKHFRKHIPDILDFIGDYPIIGHNVSFDMRFFRNQLQMAGVNASFLKEREIYDTLLLSRTFLFYLPNFNLTSLSSHLGIDAVEFHRAEGDARVCAEIFIKILSVVVLYDYEVFNTLAYILEGTFDNHRHLFTRMADFVSTKGNASNSFTKTLKWEPPLNIIEQKDSYQKCTEFKLEDVVRVFSKDSGIKDVIPNFERREEQIKMAELICDALENSKFAVIEAGTGVGKSLAYLIPSSMWSETQQEARVVIACNTKTLQGQLFNKDIPLALKKLGISSKAVLLKGRKNYICLTRWHRLLNDLPRYVGYQDRATILPIVTWLRHTKTGDISENCGFNSMDSRGKVWKEICSVPGYCTTSICSKYDGCYLGKIRKEARNANLIVVNHSLLISDTLMEKKVLPEYSALIVDEAHNLVKNTYENLAVEISFPVVANVLDRIYRSGSPGSGLMVRLRKICNTDLEESTKSELMDHINDVEEAVQRLRTGYAQFFDSLYQHRFSRVDIMDDTFMQYGEKKKFTSFRNEFGDRNYRLSLSLIEEGKSLFKRIVELHSLLVVEFEDAGKEKRETLIELKNAMDEMADLINSMKTVCDEDNPMTVMWYNLRSSPKERYISLNFTRFDIENYLYENLFSNLNSAVFTSATMKVDDSFEYFLDRTGINFVEGERIETLTLKSPFDYSKQLKFYSYHKQENKQNQNADLAELLIELSRIFRKGTLVLFTSFEAMYSVYRKVNEVLNGMGIEVLVQTKGVSRDVLLERFKKKRTSVLLGTESFWEGIDIVGDALQILIIHKLPFDIPSDPIVQAYCEKLQNSGKNHFLHYFIPEAIIKFRQAFGRLIRSKKDIGVVINFDTRIDTKYYGRHFKKALPVPVEKVVGIGNIVREIGTFFEQKED